jgi:Kef-type K+ transport system membrane component KefB
MEPVQLAAILAAVVVLASIVSVELGIAVALLELGFGVVVGNVFSLHSQEWLDFVASFASIVLTFLAGLEIEPAYFRERFAASVAIGLVSFAGPFLIGGAVAYLLLGWTVKAALIAGTALSTTSLAVIYAVLVEDGLNETRIGKLLMSATFVTDMATAIALTAIFIKPSVWFPVFLVVSVALVVALPRIARPFFRRYGDRVIEPEIKLVFVCLFLLMVLADAAHGHAVLPAFVLGLAMSNHFAEHRQEQQRLRVVAFAFLTPFFFMRGGLNVSLGAVFANLGLLGVLLAAKLVPKLALVYPVARRHMGEHTTFGTLLMSTGLTFGTIASLFGLNAGIIDTTQFSLLITVVVLSAILPTAIAQRFFSPDRETELAADRSAAVEPVPIPAEEYV